MISEVLSLVFILGSVLTDGSQFAEYKYRIDFETEPVSVFASDILESNFDFDSKYLIQTNMNYTLEGAIYFNNNNTFKVRVYTFNYVINTTVFNALTFSSVAESEDIGHFQILNDDLGAWYEFTSEDMLDRYVTYNLDLTHRQDNPRDDTDIDYDEPFTYLQTHLDFSMREGYEGYEMPFFTSLEFDTDLPSPYLYDTNSSDYFLTMGHSSHKFNNDFNTFLEIAYNNLPKPSNTEYYNNGYNVGKREGYAEGYSVGYSEGMSADETATTIFNGILNVALVPINFFLSVFNFEILGINLKEFVSALLTVSLIIIVIRTVLGGKSDD